MKAPEIYLSPEDDQILDKIWDSLTPEELKLMEFGGKGSGHFGHLGRLGYEGGSLPKSAGLTHHRNDSKPESSQDSSIKSRLGQCYILSAKYVMENGGTLVQGYITDRIHTGRTISHAWVLKDEETVHDPVIGEDIQKLVYYALYDAEEAARFSRKEVFQQALATKHWGPWHEIDESKLKFAESGDFVFGGEGSGHFDHAGIPGHHGGSAPSDGSAGPKEEVSTEEAQSRIFQFGIQWQFSGTYTTYKYPDGLTIYAKEGTTLLPEEIRKSFLKASYKLRKAVVRIVLEDANEKKKFSNWIKKMYGATADTLGVADERSKLALFPQDPGSLAKLKDLVQRELEMQKESGMVFSYSFLPTLESALYHEMAHVLDTVDRTYSKQTAWKRAVLQDERDFYGRVMEEYPNEDAATKYSEEFAECVAHGQFPEGVNRMEAEHPTKLAVLRSWGLVK